MVLRLKVLRTKAEKFERKETLKFNFNLEQMSALDSILQDVYVATRPKVSDYEVRKALIRVFNEIAKEIYGESNEAPVVEEFGSFSMDLFSMRSDLDMSVNFANKGFQMTREKKIKTLRKFAKKFYALQSKGHVTGVRPITTAKVPILKVVDRGTGVECDLSVENRDGILKSRLIHMFCTIDERFPKLSFLMKTWAKAQNINSSKNGTLNSLSIILLVAFHLQTRRPPILPPFTALLEDGTDPASVAKLLNNFLNYGKNNKESVAELFVTLLVKLSSIERLWSKGLCVSVCEASWTSKTWDSKVATISVEDFTDRSQNVARAVGGAEMKLIYKCIQHSIRHVSAFIYDRIEGSKLQELLFGRDAKLPLVAKGSAKFITNAVPACSIPQTSDTNNFGQNAVTPNIAAMNAMFSPNVAQPCIPPNFTQTKGVQMINSKEENQEGMKSNSLLTKKLFPVDGWGRWPSVGRQQIEKAMFEPNIAKSMRYTTDLTGMPTDSRERKTSANVMKNAKQSLNNFGLAYPDGCDGSQESGGGWNREQQIFSFPSKDKELAETFGKIHKGGTLASAELTVPSTPSGAPPPCAFGTNHLGSASLGFHAVDTNKSSLRTSFVPPSKKRKSLQ